MRRFVSEDDIRHAIFQPPDTTRAFFRGRAVAKFNREIASIQWDELTFRNSEGTRSVQLRHPAHDPGIEQLNTLIREARDFAAFESALKNGGL